MEVEEDYAHSDNDIFDDTSENEDALSENVSSDICDDSDNEQDENNLNKDIKEYIKLFGSNKVHFEYLCKKYNFKYEEIISSSYSCEHHRNKCKVYCDTCNDIFSCIKCHNEDSDHELRNSDIDRISCLKCNTYKEIDQDTDGEIVCDDCKIVLVENYCKRCNIIDSSNTNTFHCSKCNMCIVGKRSNYKHCKDCESCIPRNIFKKHKCSKREISCIVCLDEYSSDICIVTKCGHSFHKDCHDMILRTHYNFPKCPKCSKVLKDPTEEYKRLEREIQDIQIPPDMDKLVKIKCFECEEFCETNYHYLALKCIYCNGYNTFEI